MRIGIRNRRGRITILDVPNDITVRELNDRYTRIIGVRGPKFKYKFGFEVLKYDRDLILMILKMMIA